METSVGCRFGPPVPAASLPVQSSPAHSGPLPVPRPRPPPHSPAPGSDPHRALLTPAGPEDQLLVNGPGSELFLDRVLVLKPDQLSRSCTRTSAVRRDRDRFQRAQNMASFRTYKLDLNGSGPERQNRVQMKSFKKTRTWAAFCSGSALTRFCFHSKQVQCRWIWFWF